MPFRGGRLAVGLVTLCLLGLLAAWGRTPSSDLPTEREGLGGTRALVFEEPDRRQPAAVASGLDLTGRGNVTSSQAGAVVVVNVWASWCGPCRRQAPELNEASRDLAGDAIFVGLDVGESSPEHARAFVDVNRVPYPNIYDPDGSRLRQFAGVLAPNAVPSTLVIDRQGRVAVRISGAVTRATLVELARDIATEPG